MKMERKMGLVLEGGGMRGVFTSGVLDAFMKHDLYFPYTVAVSAGACNGMSYISRQPRRARISNIDYLARYEYIGLRHLVTQGCIFDRRLLYDKFPNQLLPFDFDTFFQHAEGFEMVTTNCLTGHAMYLSETHDKQRALDIVRASSSLPYVSKIVNVDGIPMLDGGHLLYYLIELATGRPLGDRAMQAGQMAGLLLLAGLMGLAFYNDIIGLAR